MKKLIYYLSTALLLLGVSCEQDEIDPGKVKFNELSGEWFVNYDHAVYGLDPFGVGYTRIITSSTASESETEMIITDESNFWDYRVKSAMSISDKTFGSVDQVDNLVADYGIKVIVENGKIIEDAVTLPSGLVADSIYFEIWFEDLEGATGIENDRLIVSGYRRTGFEEDEH